MGKCKKKGSFIGCTGKYHKGRRLLRIDWPMVTVLVSGTEGMLKKIPVLRIFGQETVDDLRLIPIMHGVYFFHIDLL